MCRWWNGGRWGTAALCASDLRKYCGDVGAPHTASGTTVPHSERDPMCMPYYQHVFKMCTNHRFSNQVSVPVCLCSFADHMAVHHKYTELSTIQTTHSTKPVKMYTCRLVSDVGLRLIMYHVSKLWSIFSSILLKFKNKYIDPTHVLHDWCVSQILHQLISSAVGHLTTCLCHDSDGHIFSHNFSEVMTSWKTCNSI